MLISSGLTRLSALANRAKLSHLLLLKLHLPIITPLCFSAMVHWLTLVPGNRAKDERANYSFFKKQSAKLPWKQGQNETVVH